MIKTRRTCRVCGSALYDIFDLGNFHIVGYDDSVARLAPLCLSRCNPKVDEKACGLVQLRHTVPSYLLYSDYYYRSGINTTMKNHLHDIAQKSINISGACESDVIIDIGCNDGTSLQWFADNGFVNLYGFDPAKNISHYSKQSGATIVEDFFSYGSFLSVCKNKAKLISSIAMFYDLENPHDFVRSIALSLDIKGIWVLELAYLPFTLSQNAIDTMCHEHLEYYCLHTLENLINIYNLEVVDVYTNDTNGGSFQIYVGHKGQHMLSDEAGNRIQSMRKSEFNMALDEEDIYASFYERVQANRSKLIDCVRAANQQNLKVYAYGASTKGAITLQYCGLNQDNIVACADRNPEKWGKCIAGTGIPIISEDEARSNNPDYLIVLPWHFMSEFLIRENDFLTRGGKFVQPMPEFKIIGNA